MADQFKIERTNSSLIKYTDKNGNGSYDKGEEVTSVIFSDSTNSGKFDKVRMTGDVSLFGTDEVAKFMDGKEIKSSTGSLASKDGKATIDPCKQYEAGDFLNSVKAMNAGSGSSSSVNGNRGTSSEYAALYPYEHNKTISDAYQGVLSNKDMSNDGYGYYQAGMEYLGMLADSYTQSRDESFANIAKNTNDGQGKGGFVLDPNAAGRGDACDPDAGTGAPVGVGAGLGAGKNCPFGTDESGNCKDDPNAGKGLKDGAGNGNGDHHGLDETGYNGLYVSKDKYGIYAKKDQWLSKMALAMYGVKKDDPNFAKLIEGLALVNEMDDEDQVARRKTYHLPKEIEYQGAYFKLNPPERTNPQVQIDADKARVEIKSSKSGYSATTTYNDDAQGSVESPAAPAKPAAPKSTIDAIRDSVKAYKPEESSPFGKKPAAVKPAAVKEAHKTESKEAEHPFWYRWFIQPILGEAAKDKKFTQPLTENVAEDLSQSYKLQGLVDAGGYRLSKSPAMASVVGSGLQSLDAPQNKARLNEMIKASINAHIADAVKLAMAQATDKTNAESIMTLTQRALTQVMSKEGQALIASAYPEIARQITDPKNKEINAQVTEFVKQQIMAQLDQPEVEATIQKTVLAATSNMSILGMGLIGIDKKSKIAIDSTLNEYKNRTK